MTGRWGFISAHRADFGVQRICRVLEVSRSGYYRWLAGAEARQARRAADDALVGEIREIHADHKGTYGVRRIHAELRGFGHTVNRKRVERLMRVNSIEGRHLRRRKRTTVPDRLAPPAPDLINRVFHAGPDAPADRRRGAAQFRLAGAGWLARSLSVVCLAGGWPDAALTAPVGQIPRAPSHCSGRAWLLWAGER
ncbi:IS3 family transposase [Streptomyces sp. PA03-6a]|nr:IS3 family transposase [Streptomyces sp. PA03-6a]